MLKEVIGMLKFIPVAASTEYFLPWLASLRFLATSLMHQALLGRNIIVGHQPSITFDTQKWLTDYLKNYMNVFEYGSGGSTIFISKRVKELVSVEHDKHWYHLISDELVRAQMTNCRLLLIEPDRGMLSNIDHSHPESYLSASPAYQGLNFKRYATSIRAFPDESFDLVFIDGRARPSCIANALDKVRPGGYLMLDNSERKYYRPAKNLLKKWHAKRFYGIGPYARCFWETTVWRKPFRSLF